MADERYSALLIGNSLYPDDPHNLPELKGPVNDLPMLRDALTDPQVGLFDRKNVRALPERSKREIATAMEEFFQAATMDSLVLLYYSGHGRRDEYDNLYLCARDTRTNLLMSTGISDSEINAMMRSCPARTFVVMLDCCYSGSFKGAGLPTNLRGAGRFLITSSRHGQLSADSEEPSGASAFTHHLVEALKSGTLDPNRDGYVSLNDVYDYVLTRLQRDTKQIPERHFDHTVGDVAMALSRDQPAVEPRVTDAKAGPELAVSETQIEIANVQPGERLPPEIVDVFNRGGGELDWVAESDAGWIRVEPQPGYLRLWLQPGPGSNRGNVRIRDRGGGGARTIRVHVEVLEHERRPRLRLSTTNLDFGELRLGMDSPSRSVQLVNLGGGPLDPAVTATHPWIEARHLGDTVDVTIDTRAAGDVDGEIVVTSAGGTEAIHVTGSVRAGPILQVGLARLDFGPVPAGARPVRVVPVRNSGDGELSWNFRYTGDFGTVERVPDGLAVRLTRSAIGHVRGTVWVLSDGGQAVVEVRADVVRAGAGRRPALVLLGLATVLTVLLGVAAAALVASRTTSGPATTTGSAATTPVAQGGLVAVPHVYGLSEAAGGQRLRTAGFPVRSILVCSGSVSRGSVRQVLTDVGAGEGQVVDDQGGADVAPAGTALVMKISTGVSCSAPPPAPSPSASRTAPTPSPNRTGVTPTP